MDEGVKIMKNYDTAWFQTNISFKCNANCSFCYVPDKSNELVMPDELIDNIIDFGYFIIDKYGTKKIKITFLGGEPLLQLDKVEYMAKKAKDLPCESALWLFTNGILLTDEIMKRLSQLGVFVVLSANQSYHEDILRTCEIISKYQPLTRVAIVIDESSILRLEFLTKLILEKGYHVRYFSESVQVPTSSFLDLEIRVLDKCFDMIDSYVDNPKRLVYLYENFDPRVTDRKSPYLVGRSACVFDPGGTVRPSTCMRKMAILGNLIERKDWIEEMRNYPNRERDLPRWSAYHIPECQNCEVMGVCQGGYPPPRYSAHGRFDKPTPYCMVFKKMIPKFVNIYRRKLECQNTQE